ncbi:AI-2E family transporter [Parasphingopyxis algicola]|uniref:AI-2E family transporter n=1 Tax=Parasphingopyxis algicola TaxID=2026624 RepID=UPI0015A202EE|nr:AI-2E family transporter [Parasphingopyxis algicola]QLC25255.1 AI-2E family transporter [Parasphingopyxis algicola]
MNGQDERPGPYDGRAGPAEVRDPVIRQELKRAIAWAMVAIAVILIWQLAQALLLIVAGLVFASLLDGGTKLLRPIIPYSRPLRLFIVVLLIVGGIAGVGWLAGIEIAAQAGELRTTLTEQFALLLAWLDELGMTPGGIEITQILRDVLGSVGSLTSALGSAVSGVATLFLVMVIGLFVAIDPNIYDRGVQWMLPRGTRPEFRRTTARMAKTLQRLLAGRVLGMVFEGFITWLALTIVGVPMALLLGILAGLLAFIPNIGAFITGVLMVAVGLSASPELGLYAFFIYLGVQTFDGYVVIPMVAKQTVDLPPALTLSAQILFAALFGIIGLALADPIVAMVKAALERRSEHNDEEEEEAQRRAAAAGATPTDPG